MGGKEQNMCFIDLLGSWRACTVAGRTLCGSVPFCFDLNQKRERRYFEQCIVWVQRCHVCVNAKMSTNPLDSAPSGNSYHHFRQELIRDGHGGGSISFSYRCVQKCWIKQDLSTDFRFMCEKKFLSRAEIMEEFFSAFCVFAVICLKKCYLCQLYVSWFLRVFLPKLFPSEISARMGIMSPREIFGKFLGTGNFCKIRWFFCGKLFFQKFLREWELWLRGSFFGNFGDGEFFAGFD